MKTLKTISVILPMTLLLACGGGRGGGYSASVPEPIVQRSVSDEITTFSATSIEVPEISQIQSSGVQSSESTLISSFGTIESSPVENYQFMQFGNWDVGIQNDGYFFTFKFNESDILTDVPPPENGIVYAGYEGLAFAKRLDDGEIVDGKASISITNEGGQLSSFQFYGFDGVDSIEFVFDFPISVSDVINHTTETKGIRADFKGDRFIGGAFYDSEKNAELGAFGATRILLP